MSTQFQRPETDSDVVGTAAMPYTSTTGPSGSSGSSSPAPTQAMATSQVNGPQGSGDTDEGDASPGGEAHDNRDLVDFADLPNRRRHVIDRFDGAAGLFLLRVVLALLLAVKGLQKTQAQDATVQMMRAARLPAPEILGVLLGPIQIAMAVALLLGVAVRVVGFGVAASAVVALVMVEWRTGSVLFHHGVSGFTGDQQLLLAGIGLMFLGVGGGGFGLDRRVRRRREG